MELTFNNIAGGNWVNGNHNGFSADVQIFDFDRNRIQHTSEKTPHLRFGNFKHIELSKKWFRRLKFELNEGIWSRDGILIRKNLITNEYVCVTIPNYVFVIDNVAHLQNIYFNINKKLI